MWKMVSRVQHKCQKNGHQPKRRGEWGCSESLDRPSELLRISSKFHAKKQTHLHFTQRNPQCDALRSSFCNPFRQILRLGRITRSKRSTTVEKTPSFQTADANKFLKFSSLLGGGCVDICLNKEMSPSPGGLLFDAEQQNGWNVTLLLDTDKWHRLLNCGWTFRSSYAIETQNLPERIAERWS